MLIDSCVSRIFVWICLHVMQNHFLRWICVFFNENANLQLLGIVVYWYVIRCAFVHMFDVRSVAVWFTHVFRFLVILCDIFTVKSSNVTFSSMWYSCYAVNCSCSRSDVKCVCIGGVWLCYVNAPVSVIVSQTRVVFSCGFSWDCFHGMCTVLHLIRYVRSPSCVAWRLTRVWV